MYRFAGVHVFEQFSQVFPSYWVASAFKGAFGETLVVPDVNRHLQNNLNWLQVISHIYSIITMFLLNFVFEYSLRLREQKVLNLRKVSVEWLSLDGNDMIILPYCANFFQLLFHL